MCSRRAARQELWSWPASPSAALGGRHPQPSDAQPMVDTLWKAITYERQHGCVDTQVLQPTRSFVLLAPSMLHTMQ